jgi:hypothetical protein
MGWDIANSTAAALPQKPRANPLTEIASVLLRPTERQIESVARRLRRRDKGGVIAACLFRAWCRVKF